MALEGTLQDMSLVDLFQIFDSGLKTGILELNSMAHQATLCINQGQPIDATIVRHSDRGVLTQGEAAVFEILKWEDATFCFRYDPQVGERTPLIFRDSATLVMEGMRRLQEHRLPTPAITPESRFRMAAPTYNPRGDVSLDLIQWRILSQMAISNNLRQICANTGLAIDVVVQVASNLAQLGLIEVVQEPLAPPTLAPQEKRHPENPFHSAPAAATRPSTGVTPAAVAARASTGATPGVQPGKTLLNAIMRRVRGL